MSDEYQVFVSLIWLERPQKMIEKITLSKFDKLTEKWIYQNKDVVTGKLHRVYSAIIGDPERGRWNFGRKFEIYSTRRRSVPDINSHCKPGAELLGMWGQWSETDGSLVDLRNGSKTMKIVLKRCFSKYFTREAIPERKRRDEKSPGKTIGLIQCLKRRFCSFWTVA